MANKQYISPVRLFDHCGVEYINAINPARIKKQLVAEFGFAANGFIEVDGYTYNKTDVQDELEKPDFPERFVYHRRVWQNKVILHVLEDNQVDLAAVSMAFDEFQNDIAFDDFFSPYFAAPFNHISRSFINTGRLDDLGHWLWFRDFLLAPEREEGFNAIRIFFEENERLFHNISRDNYKSFRGKIAHWLQPGWPMLFNNLPDEFYQLRTAMIVDLINLTVKLQKGNGQDCRAISNGLIQLKDVPDNLSVTISNNHNIFNGTASSSSGKTSYWWIIWLVIMVLRMISSGGCN